MSGTCGNKIKHTCGQIQKATCVDYETNLPEFSEIEGCPTIEETTTELYEQIVDIREQIDLSALGEQCLEYITDEEDRIIVKNVLLKFEEKICEFQNRIEELESENICSKSIASCNLDLSCLELPCEENILTVGNLFQALINKSCE